MLSVIPKLHNVTIIILNAIPYCNNAIPKSIINVMQFHYCKIKQFHCHKVTEYSYNISQFHHNNRT